MSVLHERLRTALKTLHTSPFTTIAAEVLDINRTDLTVDVKPLNGGPEIFDVRLRAAVDADRGGVVLVPVKGSTVLVSAVNDNWDSAYVVMVSEVDLITIKTVNESLKQWQKDLLAAVRRITHTSPAGETKPPTNFLEFQQLETRLDQLFLD